MRNFILTILFMLVFLADGRSQQLGADATISILTCNPGEEVYSLYGHSAIRVKDPSSGIDAVFNYGVFSYDQPNFIYRFAKGLTDYLMIGQRFVSWLPEYEKEQRSVYEQVLNLTPEGKNKLFAALLENAKPENREYRYNFFMDNCATRVRDIIARNSGSTIQFTEGESRESYRQLIKLYHHSFRWTDFGIDLLVGKKAEEKVSPYGQMFLPDYLKDQFSKATISIDGKQQQLVVETKTLLEYPNSKNKNDLPWPTIVFGILFLVVLYISARAYRQNKSIDWLDYSLMGVTGLAGLIIGWFTLFSEHPAMSPNYNLLWAFPLNIFFAVIWSVKKWRPTAQYFYWISGVMLLLSFIAGQQFNPAVYCIILILLVRVAANLNPEKK